MQGRRLFFALWPETALRAQIASLAGQIETVGARPVIDTNLHITLAFLGSVPDADYSALSAAGAGIRSQLFSLSLDSLVFWNRAGIISLQPSLVPSELRQLKQSLDQALAGCGYPPEQRPYRPHVSLFRQARQPAASLHFPPIEWQARDFCLVQSETCRGSLRYTPLESWKLG